MTIPFFERDGLDLSGAVQKQKHVGDRGAELGTSCVYTLFFGA